jgi:hypothetical protein
MSIARERAISRRSRKKATNQNLRDQYLRVAEQYVKLAEAVDKLGNAEP